MKNKSILLETLIITTTTLLGMWFLPAYKTIFALLPLVYLLIERRLRHRTWNELGFKFHSFLTDLRANWIWFMLVGLISQPAVTLLTKFFFPAFLEHVKARLPFDEGMGWALMLLLMAITLVLEELTYRTLIQGRLTLYLGVPLAIVIASILFGFAHYASGSFWIVFLDVGMIIVDSVLFGIIFKRSGNLVVTWLAHFIGNVLGLLVILAI